MAIIKCPRCDINFIKETDGYCPICIREMKGEAKKVEILDMCIECGENPSLPGEDICAACMMDKALADEAVKSHQPDDEPVPDNDTSVNLDTIDVNIKNEEIPDNELEVIHKELSFNDLEEEEDELDDDLDDDDNLGF